MGEKLNNADGQTFEQSLEELETILSELENSKVPLDKLVENTPAPKSAWRIAAKNSMRRN